jgi:hypothetical protein
VNGSGFLSGGCRRVRARPGRTKLDRAQWARGPSRYSFRIARSTRAPKAQPPRESMPRGTKFGYCLLTRSSTSACTLSRCARENSLYFSASAVSLRRRSSLATERRGSPASVLMRFRAAISARRRVVCFDRSTRNASSRRTRYGVSLGSPSNSDKGTDQCVHSSSQWRWR